MFKEDLKYIRQKLWVLENLQDRLELFGLEGRCTDYKRTNTYDHYGFIVYPDTGISSPNHSDFIIE